MEEAGRRAWVERWTLARGPTVNYLSQRLSNRLNAEPAGSSAAALTLEILRSTGRQPGERSALSESLPKQSPPLLFACARLSDESAHPCARHPIAQGCRASPARSRPARMAIRRAIATASTSQRRPTWHLASSRCCAGNGPEFLATMAAVMKMSLRRARWLVLCRRACVALDALLKTPRLCPLVRVSVRTMRLLLIARGPRWGLMGAADL